MSQSKGRDPFGELYAEFADRLQGDRWQPDVDVFETEREVVVKLEIAGIPSQDLRVTVDAQILRVSGVRRARQDPRVQKLHQMEIATGPFERRVRIPVPIERERVSAHLADGFLTVTLPKRGPRRVAVETPGPA